MAGAEITRNGVTNVSISGGDVALHEITGNEMPAGVVARDVNGHV
jgi:hypothetical protein